MNECIKELVQSYFQSIPKSKTIILVNVMAKTEYGTIFACKCDICAIIYCYAHRPI